MELNMGLGRASTEPEEGPLAPAQIRRGQRAWAPCLGDRLSRQRCEHVAPCRVQATTSFHHPQLPAPSSSGPSCAQPVGPGGQGAQPSASHTLSTSGPWRSIFPADPQFCPPPSLGLPPTTVGCPPGLPFWLPPQSLHPAGCPVCHTVAPSPREPPRPVWSPEPPEQPGCPA